MKLRRRSVILSVLLLLCCALLAWRYVAGRTERFLTGLAEASDHVLYFMRTGPYLQRWKAFRIDSAPDVRALVSAMIADTHHPLRRGVHVLLAELHAIAFINDDRSVLDVFYIQGDSIIDIRGRSYVCRNTFETLEGMIASRTAKPSNADYDHIMTERQEDRKPTQGTRTQVNRDTNAANDALHGRSDRSSASESSAPGPWGRAVDGLRARIASGSLARAKDGTCRLDLIVEVRNETDRERTIVIGPPTGKEGVPAPEMAPAFATWIQIDSEWEPFGSQFRLDINDENNTLRAPARGNTTFLVSEWRGASQSDCDPNTTREFILKVGVGSDLPSNGHRWTGWIETGPITISVY